MKTTIIGRKLEITKGLKSYAEKKYAKLDKFFNDDAEAKITMSVEKDRQKVEATIFSQNMIYRSEETTNDMYSTIDKIVDSIEHQIRKHKTRLEKRLKEGSLAYMPTQDQDTVEEEKEFNVVRTKMFETKPMSAEEAILQMNLLGHSFFVFRSDVNGKTSIVYKRNDKNYGIIEVN
ncbi:MAG: putative sigma-54 modulation protein [Firmicutes bacterium ADurb.Bin193]|nr:MAG: putative sigma-54 modulation protein [Firmicutes bacterium ADurb.Bin193]